ncbi:hypothetical protein GHT06_018404 [Daphnia sinensis]|uniref:Uncharacterized protein n=1 Tax=Daphnia sinensis TaxID=1820382 RepID=A0AAD5PQU6_9CRUS|nr:hypothetical protein GHT06_018404 [Daphnia sinensis]
MLLKIKSDQFREPESEIEIEQIPVAVSKPKPAQEVLKTQISLIDGDLVRLIRAQNDHHSDHVGRKFCTATIKFLEKISSILGPKEVCFLSQDDKARVPIGMTAANKQTPFLMHMEYRVSFPDHNWVVAEKHKFIPSVYAGMQILPNGIGNPAAVGYSGPTYIAVRSGKHSSSTAFAHGFDFERLLELPEFEEIAKTDAVDKTVKPIIILSVDAGLILPHDHFGRHLDGQGRTIDTELEKRNFQFAGRMLTSELDDEALLTKDEKWFSDHVRTSQYYLQIVKCNDLECCMKPRSSYFSVIPARFLPPPIPLEQSSDGLKAPERANGETHIFPSLFVSKTIKWDDTTLPKSTRSFKVLPYDLYCPSVQSSLLDRTRLIS